MNIFILYELVKRLGIEDVFVGFFILKKKGLCDC